MARAAVAYEAGKPFTIVDLQVDAPRGREVLVDVRGSGLCHSDLNAVRFGHTVNFPSVRGHEVAGVVAAVGPDTRDLRVGQHVVGSLVAWCGECEQCRAGRLTRCRMPRNTLRAAGEPPRLSLDAAPIDQAHGLGGFAEQIVCHENQLTVVPDAVPFAQAAIIGCSTVTGVGAVLNTARVQAGETMLVIGAGGVGLNVIMGGVLAQAGRIVVVDIADDKLEVARSFGATETVLAGPDGPLTQLRKLVPDGFDHAFEIVGRAETQATAWQCLGVGGSAYLMGMSARGTELIIDTSESHRMQKTVTQLYLGSTNTRRDIPVYAEMYLAGKLDLDRLVTQEIKLDDINDAYGQLERGEVIRSVITEF